MKVRVLFVTTLLFAALHAQAGQLVWGPMLGYQTHREVFLSLEVKDAKSVALDYWIAGKPETKRTLTQDNPAVTPAGGQVVQFRPGMLEMGATYEYALTIDGQKLTLPHGGTFRTMAQWEWRTPPPDFKFLLGSCLYVNDPTYDRPGEGYGKSLEPLKYAAETGADFMLWLGDNWYYREADYSSISGLWYRTQHTRAIPEMQKLLAVMHHYATWDDHDYGPNDGNWSFEFRDEALSIFKAYWGNPSYGERDNPGVYTKFYWGDAAFLVLDDYFYRDDFRLNQDTAASKSQWGRRQLEWLKQSLLQVQTQGHYTFKFIANGTQFLQTAVRGSSHEAYRREREELLQFIAENNITGVVFLTGDVHHSGINRRRLNNGYWVYEITSSPLSAGSWAVERSPKANDATVIKETLVGDQNFVAVQVTGADAERALVVTCTDKQGVQRFSYTIKATEIGPTPRRRLNE